MIDTSEIVDGLVALLRDISDLVALLNGEDDRIYAYHDAWPTNVSLAAAVTRMPAPAIMVAWDGAGPVSFGGGTAWAHRIKCYLRIGEPTNGLPTYFTLFRAIVKGVPNSTGEALEHSQVHASCWPMEVPEFSRQTDAEGVDYCEVALTFVEMGND